MTGRAMISADELLDRVVPISNQETLLRVSQLCSDPNAEARDVIRFLELDQGLATLVLRLGNNAADPAAELVIDLPRAVSRVGLRMVGTMAATAVMLRMIELAPRDAAAESRSRLHKHSIHTGVTARLISPKDVNREQALAVGLLHNVGLFSISVSHPVSFQKLLELSAEGVPFDYAEAELFEIPHAQIGALLAERWELPEPIVTGIREHDATAPTFPVSRTVKVADLLMRQSGYGIEPVKPIDEGLFELAAASPIDSTQKALGEEWPRAADIVRLLGC